MSQFDPNQGGQLLLNSMRPIIGSISLFEGWLINRNEPGLEQ